MSSFIPKETIQNFTVGMAYVPWQHITKVYENPNEAFQKGTLFPDLYYPFTGCKRSPNNAAGKISG